MLNILAVNCRRPYQGIIQGILGDTATLRNCALEDLPSQADPFDLVLFEWNGDHRVMVSHLLTMRKHIAFKDIPVVLVTDERYASEAQAHRPGGVAGLISAPFEESTVREAIEEAMQPVGDQPTIDVKLINPFVTSTLDVLRTMAQIEAERTDIMLKKDYHMMGDISGVIGILGDTMEGSVAITFDQDLARQVVGNMLGMAPEKVGAADVNDGVGEVVNMVSGNAKTLLSGEGFKFNLALPTIVSGHGHEIAHRPGTPCLVIMFKTSQDQPFAVQVAIGD